MKWHRPFRVLFVVIAVGCSAALGMEDDGKGLLVNNAQELIKLTLESPEEKTATDKAAFYKQPTDAREWLKKAIDNLRMVSSLTPNSNMIIFSFFYQRKQSDQCKLFEFLLENEQLSVIEHYVQNNKREHANKLLSAITVQAVHNLYKAAVKQKKFSGQKELVLLIDYLNNNKLGTFITFTELQERALQSINKHDIPSFKYFISKIVDKEIPFKSPSFYECIKKGLNKDESGAYEALAEIQMTASRACSPNAKKLRQALFRHMIYSAEESNKIPEESLPVNSKDLKALSL